MASKLDIKGLLVRIIGSTILIYWILHKIEWEKVIEVAKVGSPFYIFASIAAIQITVISSIMKWKMLVDSSVNQEQKRDVSVLKLGRFYYIGLFFNNFLPGSVGGDVVRVYYLGRMTGIPIAAASVAFERVTSGAALVAIALFSATYMKAARSLLFPVILVFVLILLICLLFLVWMKRRTYSVKAQRMMTETKVNKWFLKVKEGMGKVIGIGLNYRREDWKWWLSIAVLSILFQVGLAWINDLLFLSLGYSIPWLELLMIITLISVITMLPISVNGLGVREGCYVLFFNMLGVPKEIAVTVSLLFFIFVSLSSLAGGFFWMVERGKKGEIIRESVD